MPSSTSNSSAVSDSRKVAIRTSIAGILLFGSVVFLYQRSFHFAMGGEDRLTVEIDFLPELVLKEPEKKKVIVFGSSQVEAGFEPHVFDGAMEFAVGMAAPRPVQSGV